MFRVLLLESIRLRWGDISPHHFRYSQEVTSSDNRRGCTERMRQEDICKCATRRRQNGASSRCRMRVGGSGCLERGSVAVGWQKTRVAGLEQEASRRGAAASCLPGECCLRSRRGEDGGKRKAEEESQLGREGRQRCLTVRKKERSSKGSKDRTSRQLWLQYYLKWVISSLTDTYSERIMETFSSMFLFHHL